LKWTTGTAESAITDSEYHSIEYSIEAQDLQRLEQGSSTAKTITLSFWVKSSVADDFGVSIYKPDSAGSLSTRVVNPTYTINSANTWEYKTITILGDTDSSGGITLDNGIGLTLSWGIGCGPVYSGTPNTSWGTYSNPTWLGSQTQSTVTTTSGATFQITGVQLEVGDTATPFEHRSFGDELAKCKRYYNSSYNYGVVAGTASNDTPINHMSRGGSYNIIGQMFHSTPMRAAPTVVIYNPINGTVNQLKGDGSSYANAAVLADSFAGTTFYVNGTAISETVFLSVHATFDAEL